MKSLYSKKRKFETQKKQAVYPKAQTILNEVKQFICILYGSCVRFYNSVVKYNTLENMKEDLIEVLTKITFSNKLSNMIVAICSILTKEEDAIYQVRVQEF